MSKEMDVIFQKMRSVVLSCSPHAWRWQREGRRRILPFGEQEKSGQDIGQGLIVLVVGWEDCARPELLRKVASRAWAGKSTQSTPPASLRNLGNLMRLTTASHRG